MTWASLLLAAVTVERLAELWLARRNTRKLLERGGEEVAPEHYSMIVALHAAWLGGLWFEGWNQSINPLWFSVFVMLQVLRVWVLATLGRRWTTPGNHLLTGGPIDGCLIQIISLLSVSLRPFRLLSECRYLL